MIAKFKTNKVEYVLDKRGYSRNDNFTLVEKVELKELELGKPGVFEITIGGHQRVIRTDDVEEVLHCPFSFKSELLNTVQPFKVRVIRKGKSPILITKIGKKAEIKKWAKNRWGNECERVLITPMKAGLKACN
jgi:hypothetical protein